MKFSEWFEKKLRVGPYPFMFDDGHFEDLQQLYGFDVLINVSDEYSPAIYGRIKSMGVEQHWFPMNEKKKDIGLNSMFAALTMLYQCEANNRSVYLHCHAGANTMEKRRNRATSV